MAAWRDHTVLVVRLCGQRWNLESLPLLQVSGEGIPETEVTVSDHPSAGTTVDLVFPGTPLPAEVPDSSVAIGGVALDFPTLPDSPAACPEHHLDADLDLVRCESLTLVDWRSRLPSDVDRADLLVDASPVLPEVRLSMEPPVVYATRALVRQGRLRVRLAIRENQWTQGKCFRARLTHFDSDPPLSSRLADLIDARTSPPICLTGAEATD